jgi:uncharacterized membrane protein
MSRFDDEPTPPPYVPPPSEAPARELLPLRWSDPGRWLHKGFVDFRRCPGLGLFYGVAFWLMAFVLGQVFQHSPEYTMTIASGCLLVGPFLAMGLYEASRRCELGEPLDFVQSLLCWRSHVRSMGMLVGVLIVLELLWGRAALVVIAVFFDTGMPSTTDVMQAVFNPENFDFVFAYSAVGAAFATLVYAIAAVSIPMILDRDTDAISAAIVSMEVVVTHTGVMLMWGLMIAGLIGLSLLLPWGLGLVLSGPVLGHASWHAYRGTVRWLS